MKHHYVNRRKLNDDDASSANHGAPLQAFEMMLERISSFENASMFNTRCLLYLDKFSVAFLICIKDLIRESSGKSHDAENQVRRFSERSRPYGDMTGMRRL